MDAKKFRQIVKEEVNDALDPVKKDLKTLNKKADGILEFLHNVDEDVHNHEKRLRRIEAVPAIVSELQ